MLLAHRRQNWMLRCNIIGDVAEAFLETNTNAIIDHLEKVKPNF